MPVSASERSAAVAIAQSVQRLERLGVYAATVIGRRAHRSALAAYRRGRDPAAITRATIATMAPLLVDAMITSYLNGIWRLFLLARLQKRSLAISFTTSVYRQQLRILVRRTNLPAKKLAALEKNYGVVANMVTTKIGQDVNRKLGRAIAHSKRLGEHRREGVKRLSAAFENAGVGQLRSHQLEAVFRTQTMMANNAGAWIADQDPAIQEILWGYRYVAVGDDRTRPEHWAMDGITLPKDDPFWEENFPPNGWNCRCQAIALFEPHDIVRPPTGVKDPKGKLIKPQADEGFRFHPGKAFQSTGGIPGKVPAGALPLPKIRIPKPPSKAAVQRAKEQKILTTKTPRPPAPPTAKDAVIKTVKPARPVAIAVAGWLKPKKTLGMKLPEPVTIPKVVPAQQATIKTIKTSAEKQRAKRKRLRLRQRAVIVRMS